MTLTTSSSKFFLFVFGMLTFLLVCSCGKSSDVSLNKVLSVTDFSYTMASKQAVVLTLGGDKENYLQITIKRANVHQGYKVTSKSKTNSEAIRAVATWNGKTYVESSKHDSVIKFCIENLDEQKRIVEIEFSGKLVDAKSLSEFLSIPETRIEIAGDNFANLTKKIK